MEIYGSSSNVFRLVTDAGPVVKVVLLILLSFSIISWSIIAAKYRLLKKASRESGKFLEIFWNSNRLDRIYESSKKLSYSPLTELFKAGYIELINLKKTSSKKEMKEDTEHPAPAEGTLTTYLSGIENIERSLKRARTEELTNLEKLVPFLATTGSSAPFIGLFGTVWGIMNSFINIGATKDTSLAVVAPGISEALIATAVGLFAAIPAVVAYNYFVSKIRTQASEMDNFAADFLNVIKRHFF